MSTHLVRHSIGVTHYVESNRDDRGGQDVDRNTPVNHAMLINAQALIAMARKRLCSNAHKHTMRVMQQIKTAVKTADPDLAAAMVPDCIYRGTCNELKSCGGARNER